MATGVRKGVYSEVFRHFCQLSLNKYFDPSTPSMRKVNNGEKKGGGEKKIMAFKVAINVVASQQPERRLTGTLTACAN